MRDINKIVIHCSATKPSMDIWANHIRQWHLDRGWSDIGYHYIISRKGLIEKGRPVEKQGAHAFGHNRDSIGICLVGGIADDGKPDANFTFTQYAQLMHLVMDLRKSYDIPYNNDHIFGHRDVANKACPSFCVKSFFNFKD